MKVYVVSDAEDRIGLGTIRVIRSSKPEKSEDGSYWLFMSDKGEVLALDWIELDKLHEREDFSGEY